MRRLLFGLVVCAVLALGTEGVVYQIQRPKDLPAASTVTDADYMVLDQGAVGVRKVQVGFLRSIFGNTNGMVSNLSGVAVSVKGAPFFAQGDGTTDDTTAIQAAIAYAQSGLGGLYFPAGTYRHTGPLAITAPLQIRGDGAKLLLSGSATVGLLLQSPSVTIRGLEFDTDRVSVDPPVSAIVGVLDGNDNIHIEGCTFHRLRIRIKDANSLDEPAANNGLWISGNQFLGDYSGATGNDTANVIDVRGYRGVQILNNYFAVSNEERFAHLSGVYDFVIQGNTFFSGGTSIGASIIDTFANCRRGVISGNVITATNSSYAVAIQAKPTSSMFSEHTDLVVSGNIINLATASSYAAGVALYGSWGLADSELRTSQASVTGNEITIIAPNASDAPITVRGFAAASVRDNKILRADRRNYTSAIDLGNNKDAQVSGNICEYGYIICSGAASNPSGSYYQRSPETVTITGNRLGGWNHLGGIAITACTNLASLVIANNAITSDMPSNGYGSIYLDLSPGMTNLIVQGNAIVADCPELTISGTASVANEVITGNSWQSAAAAINSVEVSQTGTNLVVDFTSPKDWWTVACTADVHLSSIHPIYGKTIMIRLRAGAADRAISYDPAWIVAPGTPLTVSSNHTAVVRVTSFTNQDESGNVAAEAWDQNTDDYPAVFRNVSVNQLEVTAALTLRSAAFLPNNTWVYGRNAAGNANVAAIGVDTGNAVRIAPEGGQTVVGGRMTVVNALDADANGTAGETRLLLYDVTAGAMKRVSVGAADSGGTGYKALRVPN